MNSSASSSRRFASLMPSLVRCCSNYPPILRKTSQDSVMYSHNFRQMSARPVSSVTHRGGQTTCMSCCGARTPHCASPIRRQGRRRRSRPPTLGTCDYGMRAIRTRGCGIGRQKSRRWGAPGPMRTSSSSTKKMGWALNWHGISCGWPLILRVPPRQNRNEDPAEEDEPERKADAVSEALGDVVQHDARDDDVHAGDEVEQEPPQRPAGDIEGDEP